MQLYLYHSSLSNFGKFLFRRHDIGSLLFCRNDTIRKVEEASCCAWQCYPNMVKCGGG